MSRPAALVDPGWHENALRAIELLARRQGNVTSEDLRRVMEAPENENHIGAAFLAASQQKIITRSGYRPSRDKSRRGGVISVWQLHPRLQENTHETA